MWRKIRMRIYFPLLFHNKNIFSYNWHIDKPRRKENRTNFFLVLIRIFFIRRQLHKCMGIKYIVSTSSKKYIDIYYIICSVVVAVVLFLVLNLVTGKILFSQVNVYRYWFHLLQDGIIRLVWHMDEHIILHQFSVMEKY